MCLQYHGKNSLYIEIVQFYLVSVRLLKITFTKSFSPKYSVICINYVIILLSDSKEINQFSHII